LESASMSSCSSSNRTMASCHTGPPRTAVSIHIGFWSWPSHPHAPPVIAPQLHVHSRLPMTVLSASNHS
jgi:hypothetical protein